MDMTPTTTRSKTSSGSSRITLLLVVAFAGLLVAVMMAAVALDRQGKAEVRSPAPGFELSALDGSKVSLADYRGLVVLLNFWASWCPPCRAEMPDLDAFQQQYRDQGFAVVAVNMGEDAGTARAFMEENDLHFPVLLDTYGSVYDRYDARALPSSFIIGRDGTLIKAYPAGVITRAQLERDVVPLLGG